MRFIILFRSRSFDRRPVDSGRHGPVRTRWRAIWPMAWHGGRQFRIDLWRALRDVGGALRDR